ncbi:hypothetical protein RJ640_023700 [Escallonia rubra]|uniref:Uncharacterized protein n=1 Tax=Escallonia rubra TaxID=112253 RepID=A0AA88QGX4_9ASTE|nr:hypothetical protein RJ640_023700 [Escallonia rubra]
MCIRTFDSQVKGTRWDRFSSPPRYSISASKRTGMEWNWKLCYPFIRKVMTFRERNENAAAYVLSNTVPLNEQARREREELDNMLEENRRRVEQAQRREALELQRKEEERYRELELIQRQKEEAARRKKLEEEEERADQMKFMGKNKTRLKVIGL